MNSQHTMEDCIREILRQLEAGQEILGRLMSPDVKIHAEAAKDWRVVGDRALVRIYRDAYHPEDFALVWPELVPILESDIHAFPSSPWGISITHFERIGETQLAQELQAFSTVHNGLTRECQCAGDERGTVREERHRWFLMELELKRVVSVRGINLIPTDSESSGQTPPATSKDQPDGPTAGCYLWWQGKRHAVPRGEVYSLLEMIWNRESVLFDDLDSALTNVRTPSHIRQICYKLNKILRKAGIPWRLSSNSKTFEICKIERVQNSCES